MTQDKASQDRLALEFITTFGMPPVEHIELTAKLGLRQTGMALSPIVTIPGLYPEWDMRNDPALRKSVAEALRQQDVSISVAEGFLLMPGRSADDQLGDLDMVAELGARLINLCCLHPEFSASLDAFSRFAELAAERGLNVTVEFLPGMGLVDLNEAAAVVVQSGQSNTGLLIDAMHLFRSGASAADLQSVQAPILYAQICDVPMPAAMDNYGDEARFHRLPPGDGDLPLADFIRALPQTVPLGLEVPMRGPIEAGTSVEALLRPIVTKTRALLQAADADA